MRTVRNCYFDIETDGLDATKIHCICAMTDDDNTMYNFIGDKCYEQFREWLVLEDIRVLVGHNAIGFDVPVLRMVSGDSWDYDIRDTLVLSRLVNPSMLLGDKINQLSSLLPHEAKGKIKSKKNKFLTLNVIKN